jgi:glycosyltransferase involved in cell wall biosynthesis
MSEGYMSIKVLYYGADSCWTALQHIGFYRRNTCLLKAIGENASVESVYVVIPYTRFGCFLRGVIKTVVFRRQDKVRDVYIPFLCPGQRHFELIKYINGFIARMLLRMQGVSFQTGTAVNFAYWPTGMRSALWIAPHLPTVFDTDHNIIDDENFDTEQKQQIAGIMDQAKKSQALVLSASRSMLSYLRNNNFKCRRLRNGVDVDRFCKPHKEPFDLADIPRPIIGYVGTLSKWMDINALISLAQEQPDWSFVIVGQAYQRDVSVLKSLPNVHLLGRRKASEIPAYMTSFDVAVSLYRQDCPGWLDPDSMKIFEYLAASVPVVCLRYHDYLDEDFCSILEVEKDVGGIRQRIRDILEMKRGGNWKKHVLTTDFLKENLWTTRSHELVGFFKELIQEQRTGEKCGRSRS